MKSILNKAVVLELNKCWFPIGLKTPKKVFENFSSGNLLGLAMDFSDEDIAREDYSNPDVYPLGWDEWIKLPVRDWELSICTPNMEIRVPNIVIAAKYDKIPNKPPKLSKRNVMLRDNYTCQFTGVQYPRAELNIDHIVPRSKGGKNTWENMVTCHKSVNTRKGDLTLKEAGLKLIRNPKKPTATSLFFADKMRDPKWEPFLKPYLN